MKVGLIYTSTTPELIQTVEDEVKKQLGSDVEMYSLEDASILADAPHHAYSGQCTYCGHCAPCPKGIDIAMVNKLYDLAAMQPQVPESIRAHYQALSARAEDCIACGNCEKRCPFGVPVIARMEKVKELHLL